MNWNKILMETLAILIQGTAYSWAKRRMNTLKSPWILIMPVMACAMSILLTSSVYGPVGMLVLSIVLLYWEALREGL